MAALLLEGCYRDKPAAGSKSKNDSAIFFPFFLWQKTMIVNCEQNNETEGHYLKITAVINDSVFQINLPGNFYINSHNFSSWMLGWPTGKAYYDAGNENLRAITRIDISNKTVTLGNLLRGVGAPKIDDRVVFWNRSPSGFANSSKGVIINTQWWNAFAGNSAEFGAIVFDSAQKVWIMYVQEVDTTHVNIYAATSPDLRNWTAANNGNAILKAEDFEACNWAGTAADGVTPQTARLYSAIKNGDTWYLFLSGYDKQAKRHIGLITAKDPLNGPFQVHMEPVISPGSTGCDVNGCFYPKVCRKGKGFQLYYDGEGSDNNETLCMAESQDLIHWKKYEGNPVIDAHYGWRSGRLTSEPNYARANADTVWVMIGGYKKYNTEFSREDSMEKRIPLDNSIFSASEKDKGRCVSGNVMDAELGVFISLDGGHTFKPHLNNPVWLNDYSDTLQNDHLGGDFFYHDDMIIYQAKSEAQKCYHILQRFNK